MTVVRRNGSPPAVDLERLVADLNAGRLSRRRLVQGAARAGLSASLAASLYGAAARSGFAAPRGGRTFAVSLQDGGKTLVVAIPQATTGLDPAIPASGYGDIIPTAENLTEGLTRFQLGSAEVEPALAESWDVSEDGLSYVFHLRPGVNFHDGTPLTPDAVVTSFVRQLDESHPFHRPGMDYASISFAGVESVTATGELDVTIALTDPIVLLTGNLATFAAGVISPAAIEEFGEDYAEHIAGTGPFQLESWTKDVELVYVANEQYWGGRPAVDRVVWRTIAEDTVRISELKTGSIDIANQVDFKDVEDLQSDPNLQVVTGNFLNVQFLALNQTVPPFDNPTVRQAVQHAINKQNIADAIFYGNYTLGAGPVAPGLIGYDESLAATYPYDPERARSLLAEAGAEGAEFDLYNRTNSFWPLLGQLVQADLDAVGLTANLQAVEDAEFFAALNAGEAPAFLNDWTWDNGDPDNVTFGLFSADRRARMGYNNPQVDDLNKQGQLEADPAAREEIYRQVQQVIQQDAIMVVLGYPGRVIGAAQRVQGLTISPVGLIQLRSVTLAE
jgi:peptide/nickel transport system substrate-binding protein